MQEYFLVSATLQYAIKDFKRVYGTDMSQLPEKVASTSTTRTRRWSFRS